MRNQFTIIISFIIVPRWPLINTHLPSFTASPTIMVNRR